MARLHSTRQLTILPADDDDFDRVTYAVSKTQRSRPIFHRRWTASMEQPTSSCIRASERYSPVVRLVASLPRIDRGASVSVAERHINVFTYLLYYVTPLTLAVVTHCSVLPL